MKRRTKTDKTPEAVLVRWQDALSGGIEDDPSKFAKSIPTGIWETIGWLVMDDERGVIVYTDHRAVEARMPHFIPRGCILEIHRLEKANGRRRR